MRIEHPIRLLLLFIALGAGIVISFLRPSPGASTTLGFGDALWLNRRTDLLLQLALLVVGALGIHALLPGDEEKDTDEPLE
ncbi:MAG: hypothetical protein H5T69_08505 [Chloroflexi bacterium]|nr:hypothetical protein [Chloroflexota bacterium]